MSEDPIATATCIVCGSFEFSLASVGLALDATTMSGGCVHSSLVLKVKTTLGPTLGPSLTACFRQYIKTVYQPVTVVGWNDQIQLVFHAVVSSQTLTVSYPQVKFPGLTAGPQWLETRTKNKHKQTQQLQTNAAQNAALVPVMDCVC